MPMAEIIRVFQCQMCGEEIRQTTQNVRDFSAQQIAGNILLNAEVGSRAIIHVCADNDEYEQCGIAVLIGIVQYKEDTREG